jgi:hypothetical protein
MASNATIGALRVVLGADTAALDKGLKDAQGSLARFSAQMKNVGLVAAGALAGIIGGSAAAIKNAVNEADKLGKMAQSIGIPVEELSKLKYAAELSDISMESLGTSMVRLSKNMSAVAGGAAGPAAEAFKALGVSVKNTDGTMKSSSVVLSEVADKFAGYQDGANKTALAVALFGRAGAAMIPMLNAGSAALEDAKKEAEEFGLVIDKKTAAAAENFNDNLTRLSKVASGFWTQVSAQLAPEMARLSNEMVRLAKDTALVQSAVSIAEGIMKTFGVVTISATAWLKDWAQTLNAVVTAAKQFGNLDFSAGIKTLSGSLQQTKAIFKESEDAIFRLLTPPEGPPALAGKIDEVNKSLRDAPALATGAKNALQTFLESQNKSIVARNAETATIGMEAGALERLKIVQQAELIAKQNSIALTPLLNAQIAQTAAAAGNAALALAGMRTTQENLEPMELYRQKLVEINAQLAAGAINAETYAAASAKAAMTVTQSYADGATTAISGFQQLASEFGKTNSKMAKGAQALAVVEALINTYVGFTKALATIPPPLNYAAAAGVLAAGMAKVMAIKSQSVPQVNAFTGGSFTVPGSGGPDSRSMMMNLSPGEQVDIWRPGEGTGEQRGAGGAAPQPMTVQIADPFAREFWRRGLEQINSLTRDGYRLEVAPA